MDTPAWKQFERLTREIQQDLAKSAAVTLDEKIVGRSGVAHQCDVVVRQEINGTGFMCVIECKDHDKNIGLGTVRDFVYDSKPRDRANCSASGVKPRDAMMTPVLRRRHQSRSRW